MSVRSVRVDPPRLTYGCGVSDVCGDVCGDVDVYMCMVMCMCMVMYDDVNVCMMM